MDIFAERQWQANIAEAHRRIEEAKEAEREHIAAIIEQCDREAREREAEHAHEREQEREREQKQEQAVAAFHAQREADAKAAALRRYLGYGGQPEAFDAWYQEELNRQVRDREAAITHHYRKLF